MKENIKILYVFVFNKYSGFTNICFIPIFVQGM